MVKTILLVKYLLKVILLTFLFINSLYCFDYEIESHAKRKIIKTFPISTNEKYVSFIIEGTWSDNLGNYGLIEQSSIVITSNNKVLKLDGYGKTIYQNNHQTYFRGFRNQQEQDAGVGQTVITYADDSLRDLIGIKCTYAVKFFNDVAYVLSKCKINEKQKKILSNIRELN